MPTTLTRPRLGVASAPDHGVTMTGRIIRDAWVFGLLPEGDGYAGQTAADMQRLYDGVHQAWAPYGQLPSRLPPELAERHARIHREALPRSTDPDWQPSMRDAD
jgi:hypothetical protein